MDALLPQAYGFFLLLLRTAGLSIALPGVGARVVPARIRLGFALAVTVPVFLGAGSPTVRPPSSFLALAGTSVSETILGLSAGFACLMAIQGAVAAGQLASVATGLSYGSIIDHANGSQSNAIAELVSLMAIVIALSAGLHREAIAWLCREAIETPPGTAIGMTSIVMAMITSAIGAIALGYRLAFPFLAASNLGHLAFGFLGKTTPQLNLQSMGFSVSIMIGGAALYLAAPTVADRVAAAAMLAFTRS